jgi:hypothetical protein
MPIAGHWIALKRHGDELSQGQQAVFVLVFHLNNGRDYRLARLSGQPACAGPVCRQDSKLNVHFHSNQT